MLNKSAQDNKPAWSKPCLIIIVRLQQNEQLTQYCKHGGAEQGPTRKCNDDPVNDVSTSNCRRGGTGS